MADMEISKSDDLYGPVRSVRTEAAKIHKLDDTYTEGQRELLHLSFYHKQGRKEEEERRSHGVTAVTKIIFVYDAVGRLAETDEYEDDLHISKTIYTYDAQGKPQEQISQTSVGELLGKTVYSYDAMNNKKEMAHYHPNGSLSSKIISTYDEAGKMIEARFCAANQQDDVTFNLEQKEKGLSPVNSADSPDKKICGDGVLVGRVLLTHNNETTETRMSTYTADGVLVGTKVFIGDERSEQTETIEYNPDESLLNRERHIREFDQHGNWIKQTTSKLNLGTHLLEPVEVTYREITYY